MSCTVDHPHESCSDISHKIQAIKALEKELSDLRTLLAKERDEFRKKETEMRATLSMTYGQLKESRSNGDSLKTKLSVYEEALELMVKHEEIEGWDQNPVATLRGLAKQALSSGANGEAK